MFDGFPEKMQLSEYLSLEGKIEFFAWLDDEE
jgi:hypothetical protein